MPENDDAFLVLPIVDVCVSGRPQIGELRIRKDRLPKAPTFVFRLYYVSDDGVLIPYVVSIQHFVSVTPMSQPPTPE